MRPIEIKNLCFIYDRSHVLQGVSFTVEKGEFIGIIGPNGGGKTTLLKLILGFLKPSFGSIEVRGQIGYVPQAQKIDRDFPITTEELIFLGAVSKATFWGGYPPLIKQKGTLLMDRLGLIPHKDKMFGSLSGGLAQRALLARALLSDPELLLLDEATANIDPSSLRIIFDLLNELKRKKTILLVTHDLKTIVERVDRVLCVQSSVHSYLPKEMCEHFALGLYHTPLMELPPGHLHPKEPHVLCTH